MALDDHDQLQNDNGKIDVGRVRACLETWRGRKRERERKKGESIHHQAMRFNHSNLFNVNIYGA